MSTFKVNGKELTQKTITVLFDLDIYNNILNIADKNNITVSHLIRQMVDFAINNYTED